MGIDFSKFSQEIQAKIKAALEDAISPSKIDAAEMRAMNLEKEVANLLMQELSGNQEYLGDGYFKARNNNKTLILLEEPENDSFIPLTADSLDYYNKLYPDKNIAKGIYKDGRIYLTDSQGRLVKDHFNNYISEVITVISDSEKTDDIAGNFEVIENEPAERTNRRFAVALVRSMYNEVIGELNTIITQLGVLDAGFWREMLGFGVQAIADLKENQELFTATTKKKVERITSERDNICNSLSDLIDSPDEFKDKFYQLLGKDYKDNAFEELRAIQHNQDSKDAKTKFRECKAKFKELYPDNNVSENIDDWQDSVEFQKTIDGIADIVIMLMMTGGLGKLFQGSVQTMAKNILMAAAKGDKKAVMANFAKLAPEVQTIWKSLAKKEFGTAAAQISAPIAQSSLTMGSWEGIKAFLNNATSMEEVSPEELLKRTLEGIMGGVEMGAVMGTLEVAAIAPIMAKLTPFLNKLSGASSEISALLEKGEGMVSMEKVMETYTKANEALRGKIVKEGAHGVVALPVLTVGFTGTDNLLHFDSEEVRKMLLESATTDEERENIRKMSSVDLRIEFAKLDFLNQVKGMATIEGVGLIFRRLQAGRIANGAMKANVPDIIGANLRQIKENGKTVYEICSADGKVLPMKNGNSLVTRFSSIEEASTAYSALCMSVYGELTRIGEKAIKTGEGARPKQEQSEQTETTPLAQKYDKELTEYTRIGNKVFEVKPDDAVKNPDKIKEIRNEIETFRKTDAKKAEELEVVLEMFINPAPVKDVKDKQIDAIVHFLNDHYDKVEKYLTTQSGEIGLSDKKLGKFGHRIKGEWSTRDKIVNYINDAIEKEKKAIEKGDIFTPKTLLDAYKDVRDKYASRTVFPKVDFSNHPEIIAILKENNYSEEGFRKSVLRAAEIQSQPAVEMLKEAMRKAVEEGKDLSMLRISNYTSEGGIPIFSEAQLAELKEYGKDLDIDVTFIRLATEEDPNAHKMIVDGATTKAQPSGYTALQINFVTKAGEVIEWQYRGELVNVFAEAEHLPYDLRTGKHPWRQYPELEPLFKPIADLLDEKKMHKEAYKQLNRYFTDYYTHLRKLELGFESKEPQLKDYENWTVTEENGVKKKYNFKFDMRLEAKNLEALHYYAEGIKDGTITPERAVEEFYAEIGFIPETVIAKENGTSPICEAKVLTEQELLSALNELGLTEDDLRKINTEKPNFYNTVELLLTLKEYKHEKFSEFSTNMIIQCFNHTEQIYTENAPFIQYLTRDNLSALCEVVEFEKPLSEDFNLDHWQDVNIPEVYRVAKHYFELTGEKLPYDYIARSNFSFKDGFPSNEQVAVALKMRDAGLWTNDNMFGHSTDVKSPEKITDKLIQTIKTLKEQAESQGVKLDLQYSLDDEHISIINQIKLYYDKSPIDFSQLSEMQGSEYLHVQTILFYLEQSEKRSPLRKETVALMKEIDSMFSTAGTSGQRKELAEFFIDNNIAENNLEACRYAMRVVDNYTIKLAKKLFLDKDFNKNNIHKILTSVSARGNLPAYKAKTEEARRFLNGKTNFAERLCFDKSLNLTDDMTAKLIENYYEGCEELVINGIKSGLIAKNPNLAFYSADIWENILKRGLLDNQKVESISRQVGISMAVIYARAKDDNILDKHIQLMNDALANKDLLKSGMEDISDWQVNQITRREGAVKTIDLIGVGNTEAAFPLMLDEFNEFLSEVSNLNESKLSESNKELLRQKVNPQNSDKYLKLKDEVTGLKKKLNQAVGKENLAKIKELQSQRAEVEEQIKQLKQGADADSAETKQKIKELQKQSKTLGGQAQAIYYNSENSAQVKELMKAISTKQKEMKAMLADVTGLEPQEVVTKIRVISAIAEISSEEEVAEFIKMIKPSSPENDAMWNEAVNRKIFQKLGVEYDEALSQKLDLIHCKYISKLLISSEDFFENMRKLVEIIRDNPSLTVEQAIDNLPQNIETKRIFEELGFDFEKYTKVDKNSYTTVKVTLSADEAKQASIHNLEEDLNDALFQSLPKEATEPIFKALKEQLGVTFKKSQKDNWEGDGFSAGSSEYYRLYKDGKPIAFEDMDKIVTLIKREINKNDFWTKKHNDSQIDNARGTMYTHLIKMRTAEVDNAAGIKDGDTAEIEVRKTDMYDIKKALGLGNDAQCCTALGRNFNEWSAPNYIMNKCIGAIELTDKGSFVGNTMIYLAYVDGKPALVLDNIELKTKYQNNDRIRDTFIDYAKKLCAEIGQPDLPIFAGPNRHKLKMEIFHKNKHTMEIIGNSGEDEVYIDYDAGGHVVGQGEKAEMELYQIR